jgi:hypothetical protein
MYQDDAIFCIINDESLTSRRCLPFKQLSDRVLSAMLMAFLANTQQTKLFEAHACAIEIYCTKRYIFGTLR